MDMIVSRRLDSEIESLLTLFIHRYKKMGLTPGVAEIFYHFIIYSYKLPQAERYSISMLADIFNKEHMDTKMFLGIYAHSLYCLALWNHQKIYEEFII